MLRWMIPVLLLLPLPAQAAPERETAARQAKFRCVAALAIIANDQQRGMGDWDGYPPLAARGTKFSERVAQAAIKDSGMTQADVAQAILTELAALQQEGADENVRAIADRCIAMLDAEVPPPKPPTLLQCAVALNLAFEDEKAHQGMSKTARTLAVFAAVLEGRARDEMKAAGRTEAESDIVIGREKEKLLAEFKAHRKKGVQDKIDFQSCFDMARP